MKHNGCSFASEHMVLPVNLLSGVHIKKKNPGTHVRGFSVMNNE
jgi:hypothetical protein